MVSQSFCDSQQQQRIYSGLFQLVVYSSLRHTLNTASEASYFWQPSESLLQQPTAGGFVFLNQLLKLHTMNSSSRHQLDRSWLKHAGSEEQIPTFWSWAAGMHWKHHLPGPSTPAPYGMGRVLGYTAANNWVTLVKHTPHPISPFLECHSYPENQRHLWNAEILLFSKKEKTAPLILCSLHVLGERLKGPKQSPRMQTICHLAQTQQI